MSDVINIYQVPHKPAPSKGLVDIAMKVGYPREPESLVDLQVFLIKYFELAVTPVVTVRGNFTVKIEPLSTQACIQFSKTSKQESCSTAAGYYEVLEDGLSQAYHYVYQKMQTDLVEQIIEHDKMDKT